MFRSWRLLGCLVVVPVGLACVPSEDHGNLLFGTGGAGPTGGPTAGRDAGVPNAGCAGSGGGVGSFDGGIGPQPNLSAPVVRAATPPPPLSGGTLLVLADRSAAVAADPERDLVTIVDLGTRAVRAQVLLPPGDEPGRAVQDGSGRVHVALRRGGAVASIDPVSGTLLDRRAVCSAPRGIAYEPATALLHVACAGGELLSLPSASGPAVRTVMLEQDLRDVVVSSTGQLMVSLFRRAEVLLLDGAGAITGRLRPPVRPSIAMPTPRMMSPSVAWRMQPLASGGGVVMAHQRGTDDEITTGGGAYGGGRCGGIVDSALTVLTPNQQPGASPGIMLNVLPIDVALSPDGATVAVVSAGNSQAATMPQVMTGPLTSMTQPNGGCAVPTGQVPATGQVVAVAFMSETAWVAQTREPAQLVFSDGQPPVVLASDSTADTGQTIFHVNAGGGIACASCHPEGGEDGRVWRFACLGARRTQSLRGGVSGTEPFHWDGHMQTFSQLVTEVFMGRMGGPSLGAAQSAALLGWIDTIPALPARGPDAATEHGRALFNDPSVACGSCHAGPHLTNNVSVDVGTGGAVQVPSLHGVRWRPPYLHNGCAPTLRDRFGSCGGDKHGQTAQLSPADISDLIAYLETL